MNIISTYLAYKLLELLTKPFSKWDAYELGIIDDNGSIIHQPVSSEEKQAFGFFEKIIRRLKLVVTKTIGESRAASILSAIYLIKEHNEEVSKIILSYCLKECPDLNEMISIKKRLFENFNKTDEIIIKGKYIYKNEELIIENDLKPISKYFGYNIYEIQGKERKVFLKEELYAK
jgi:hypothetical protein